LNLNERFHVQNKLHLDQICMLFLLIIISYWLQGWIRRWS